ncbi:MAG: zinc dependent phospholipase C family protein [Clostridia bacterium]|nr:zinc dependent phospholipase C family protein [Clostridia bacterium]
MPASYVHQSVALASLRQLGRSLDKPMLAACLAGSEGPDALFYGFYRGKPGLATTAGIRMHRERTDTFLCTLMAQARSDLERAYCMGFLTHYAADTIFHPYVYGHSLREDGSYSSNLHGIVEHAYEIVRYRRDGYPQGIPEQLAGLRMLSEEQRKACAHLCASAICRVYPDIQIDEATLLNVWNAGVHIAAFLHSGKGIKYRFFGRLPLGLDMAVHAHMIPPDIPREDLWNDAHLPWASIFEPDRIRTESMDDLYLAATDRAAELIQAAAGVWNNTLSMPDFAASLGGLSYNSGLPWQNTPLPDQAPGIKCVRTTPVSGKQ